MASVFSLPTDFALVAYPSGSAALAAFDAGVAAMAEPAVAARKTTTTPHFHVLITRSFD
jgi:hypothetical protein